MLMVKKQAKKPIKNLIKKVSYEPNKMGLAVAAVAAVSLVLLGLIALRY